MTDRGGDVAIGLVSHVHPAGADEAKSALTALFRREPRRIEMFGLAGPNDALQILLDWATWQTFAGLVVGAYFVKLAQIAAEATPSAVKFWFAKNDPKPSDSPKLDEAIAQLISAIERAQSDRNSVILGFPMDHPKFHRRNIGIQLATANPEDLAKAAIALALIGPDLVATISSALEDGMVRARLENADCSAKIELLDDGSCVVSLIASKTHEYFKDGSEMRICYGSDGRRLS